MEGDRGLGRVRVLDDVGEALGDDEVGGGLHRWRQPPLELEVALDLDRRALDEHVDRRHEAVVGQHGRVDAARELAQLRERGSELVGQLLNGVGQLGLVLEPGTQQPEVERERDELLLGAVVQVALDLAAGVVGGLDDPAARVAELLQPRAQVGLQPLVVDRQRRGRSGGVDELGRGVELRVVHDRGDAVALALDRGPRAAGPGRRQVDRVAALVHEDAPVRQPVGDVERAVAEPLGQHLAHRALPRALRAQQRLRERAQRGGEPVRQRDRDHGGGERQGAQRERDRGPERPRADERVAGAAEAVDREQQEHDRERDRRGDERQGEQRHRQLEQEHRQRPPERPVTGRLQDAAPVAAGRARDERKVGVEQPVGLPPLALGELPHEPRDGGQQRQADPDEAEHRAEQQPAADQHEVGDAVGDADRQVEQRPARAAQVAWQLEAAAGRADRGHPRPSTSTSPEPLIACTANEASSDWMRLRTWTFPRSLAASTR